MSPSVQSRAPRRHVRVLAGVTAAMMLAGVSTIVAPAAIAAPPAACDGPVTTIGAVQGTTDVSPLVGATTTVRGVVVGDFEGAQPALRGFYLQDAGDGDPATSDGIFVFTGGTDAVTPGETVEVSGAVSEFQGQTQLSTATIGSCTTPIVVAPAELTLPLATPQALEASEGMVVRFSQTLVVTEHFQLGRFGQVVVSSGSRLPQPTAVFRAGTPEAAAQQAANNLNRLIVDDATNGQNPNPIVFGRGGGPLSATNTLRGGDTVTGATGVLTFTWAGNAASGNAYRLRPVDAAGVVFQAANPRPDTAPAVGGSVTVAGANLLNWFNTFSGCTFGTAGAVTDCRGANNQAELDRQAAKEVAELNGLGADVVGVVEVENDGYGPTGAQADLVARLNAVAGAGTWAFVDVDAATGTVDAAGDDAIKVGVIYRPAAVTPGATWADTAGAELWDRVPVAQAFTRNIDGERFTVVVNHFKSKGSCPVAGDPDADQGDGQSCWNVRRTAQAERLAGWVSDTVVPAAGDPDVLLVGDLNSYAGEDPIAVLKAAGYTDLGARFGGADAYSYAFDGQWGYLDYALASASLAPQVSGAGEWHINADEPSVLDYNTEFKTPAQVASLFAPDRYRNSDHDPVLVGFDLTSPPVPSTVTLTSSANPAVVGGPVTFTATVDSSRPGAPGGSVQFSVKGVRLGTAVPAVNGSASLTVPAVLVGTSVVGAVYSGDAGSAAATATVSQLVTYGMRLIDPAPGAQITAGSATKIRFQLLDAAGRPLPDLASVLLSLTCQTTVEVTGVQTLRRTCAGYDRGSDTFSVTWRSTESPLGAATVTARVRYPDATPATTATAAVTLVR